jgi:hypothetical protein
MISESLSVTDIISKIQPRCDKPLMRCAAANGAAPYSRIAAVLDGHWNFASFTTTLFPVTMMSRRTGFARQRGLPRNALTNTDSPIFTEKLNQWRISH